MIPYPIIRRSISAWTSASVHRPQPLSVGTEGKGTFRLGRGCLGWAYGDRSRMSSMTTADLDEAPARSSLAR